MMSAHVIHDLRRDAGNRAKREGKQPAKVEAGHLADPKTFRCPNMGDYCPPGWHIDGLILVDKMGRGDSGLSAGTAEMMEFIGAGNYAGMVEESQFQVVVARFKPGGIPRGVEVERGRGIFAHAAESLTQRMRRRGYATPGNGAKV